MTHGAMAGLEQAHSAGPRPGFGRSETCAVATVGHRRVTDPKLPVANGGYPEAKTTI